MIRGVPGFEEGRFECDYENFEVGIAQQDPPGHGRLRSLVSSAFTPRRIENLRPRIQALIDEMLEPHLATGHLELISDLADPLPAIVIAELAGFPVEDRLRFRDWTYRINNIFFGSGATLPTMARETTRTRRCSKRANGSPGWWPSDGPPRRRLTTC